MIQKLKVKEQERTADMVRLQSERMTESLAKERESIKNKVCDQIKDNMVIKIILCCMYILCNLHNFYVICIFYEINLSFMLYIYILRDSYFQS